MAWYGERRANPTAKFTHRLPRERSSRIPNAFLRGLELVRVKDGGGLASPGRRGGRRARQVYDLYRDTMNRK